MKRITTVLFSLTTFLGAVAAGLPLSAQFSAFDLGTPPGARSSSGTAINNRGQIAGSSVTESSDEGHATIWER